MTNLADKNLYVVLGMPRSGTSAITRSLKAFNIDLGDQVDKKDQRWNPTGFWEDKEIVYNINRAILSSLGHTWLNINLLESLDSLESLKHFSVTAKNLLTKRFASTQDWGFKDPRTAITLSFWLGVFQSLRLNEHYIITLRNPLASAYSYHHLMGTEIETGLLLWLAHLIPAINLTHKKKRVIVSYNAMMHDPHTQLARIQTQLQITHPLDDIETNRYIHEFLDKKLHHYRYDDKELTEHPANAAIPLCSKVYNLLQQAANDHFLIDGEEFQEQWQPLMQEFQAIYPTYCYINNLLKHNKFLEREIRTIRRSIPWKMIFPIRKIDDMLRLIRRTKREQKKIAPAETS